jgi:hypothetical protein
MEGNLFTQMLQVARMSPQQIAQICEQNGCGDAASIQNAINSKDAKGLSFVQKRAKAIHDSNPAFFNAMCAQMGVKNPFSQ